MQYNIGIDLYVKDPNSSQPNWRKDDPDDEIDDNDDPRPVSSEILNEILGFDPDDEEYDEG